MIERVWFKNFRALRDVAVGLSPFTVIVGPNSSGKTSVLEGTHYIVELAYKKLSEVLSGPYSPDLVKSAGWDQKGGMTLDEFLVHGEMVLGADGRWDGDPGSLELRVKFNWDEDSEQTPFTAGLRARWAGTEVDIDPSQDSLIRLPEMKPLRKAFGGALFLRLSPRQLAAPSYLEEGVPTVRADGEGLASVLNDLASSSPDAMAAIEEALRAVVPSIRRVRTERAAVRRIETEHIVVDGQSLPRTRERKYWGHQVVLDTTSGRGIPIYAVSEGTVLTLGFLTVLHGRNPPRLLLLDDIDRALHPKAQEDLVAQLRKILAARPELQIVATSHSPYLLDTLRFEDVRLTTLRDDGSVACAPLTDHPEYERWKDHVKPGELWTSAAESWVAARPERAP
jgi:predicted ATPase